MAVTNTFFYFIYSFISDSSTIKESGSSEITHQILLQSDEVSKIMQMHFLTVEYVYSVWTSFQNSKKHTCVTYGILI